MLEGSLLDPIDAHFYWNGTFGVAERQALAAQDMGSGSPLPLPSGMDGEMGGYLNRFLWLDQLCYLPDDILNKCDRMSMAHSLEVRPPFLDHRIVEFAATLPEDFKIHSGLLKGNSLKFILRELMKDKLPRAVLTRGKEGFDIPAHHWLRTALKPLVSETLNERTVREAGIFRWEAIDRVLRAHFERRANFGYHLWGLLLLFLWMKRWEIQPPRAWHTGQRMPASAGATH
jgi:asparagine synthase (glutamine-hydrolysing)